MFSLFAERVLILCVGVFVSHPTHQNKHRSSSTSTVFSINHLGIGLKNPHPPTPTHQLPPTHPPTHPDGIPVAEVVHTEGASHWGGITPSHSVGGTATIHSRKASLVDDLMARNDIKSFFFFFVLLFCCF